MRLIRIRDTTFDRVIKSHNFNFLCWTIIRGGTISVNLFEAAEGRVNEMFRAKLDLCVSLMSEGCDELPSRQRLIKPGKTYNNYYSLQPTPPTISLSSHHSSKISCHQAETKYEDLKIFSRIRQYLNLLFPIRLEI